jgi:hypothetical protein
VNIIGDRPFAVFVLALIIVVEYRQKPTDKLRFSRIGDVGIFAVWSGGDHFAVGISEFGLVLVPDDEVTSVVPESVDLCVSATAVV